MIDNRILICVLVSVAGHFAISEALSKLPEREQVKRAQRVEVRVVAPPPVVKVPEPPPPEPPPPETPPPPPPPTPQKIEQARPRPATPTPSTPTDTPPPPTTTTNTTTTTNATGNAPVFKVDMNSSSGGGPGPAKPSSNVTAPTASPEAARPGGDGNGTAPVSAAEVTKMPLPKGRCAGKYTDEAKEAGIEVVVVLDLLVGADGKTRDITVVAPLSHGLTEAAIQALKACTFAPGERAGQAVAVKVRGFKIRFVLDQ